MHSRHSETTGQTQEVLKFSVSPSLLSENELKIAAKGPSNFQICGFCEWKKTSEPGASKYLSTLTTVPDSVLGGLAPSLPGLTELQCINYPVWFCHLCLLQQLVTWCGAGSLTHLLLERLGNLAKHKSLT